VRRLYERHPQRESEWGYIELIAGLLALHQGRYADAEAAGRRASALYGKEFGTTGPNAATVELFTVMVQRKRADYANAEAAVLRMLDMLARERDYENSFLTMRARVILAENYFDWGRLERAEATLDSIPADVLTRYHYALRAGILRAQLLSERGRHDAALAALARAVADNPGTLAEAIRMQRNVALVEATIRVRAGDLAGARRRLVEATPDVQNGPADPAWLAAADLGAEIAFAEGRPAEALRHYAATLTDAGESRRGPLAAGKARLAYGRALAAAGRPDEARVQFRRASELLADQHAESALRGAVLALAR
jgi:tetratricopeptide (TPR) repeat protein